MWGLDRHYTCDAIAKEGWKTSDYGIIVNDNIFADALSASVLAKKYNAPILLNGSDVINNSCVYDNISRLNIKNLILVGGESILKPSVCEFINECLGQSSKKI